VTVFQDVTPRVIKLHWGPKDPGDVTNYWVDMRYWLPSQPVDVDAVSVTVTVADILDQPPPDSGHTYLAVDDSAIVDGEWVRVMLSGGVPGNDYLVYFVVTLNTSEVYPFKVTLPVKPRSTL
jgi:hypothetical protein